MGPQPCNILVTCLGCTLPLIQSQPGQCPTFPKTLNWMWKKMDDVADNHSKEQKSHNQDLSSNLEFLWEFSSYFLIPWKVLEQSLNKAILAHIFVLLLNYHCVLSRAMGKLDVFKRINCLLKTQR